MYFDFVLHGYMYCVVFRIVVVVVCNCGVCSYAPYKFLQLCNYMYAVVIVCCVVVCNCVLHS